MRSGFPGSCGASLRSSSRSRAPSRRRLVPPTPTARWRRTMPRSRIDACRPTVVPFSLMIPVVATLVLLFVTTSAALTVTCVDGEPDAILVERRTERVVQGVCDHVRDGVCQTRLGPPCTRPVPPGCPFDPYTLRVGTHRRPRFARQVRVRCVECLADADCATGACRKGRCRRARNVKPH